MNKHKLALSALTALCLNATTNGCKVQAADETFIYQLEYNQTIDASVAKPGITNAIIHTVATAQWYVYANNTTDSNVNYMTDTSAVMYIIKGTTVRASSIREQNYGSLLPFSSEFVALFNNGEVIDDTFSMSLINDPGELANWQTPHTLQAFPYLSATCVDCTIYGATPVPGNIVTVTITYQYPNVIDDDDCDHDKDHGKKPKHKHEKNNRR